MSGAFTFTFTLKPIFFLNILLIVGKPKSVKIDFSRIKKSASEGIVATIYRRRMLFFHLFRSKPRN